jgi:hypothetical protein
MESDRLFILFIVIFALGITFYCQYKGLMDPYTFNCDVNEFVFPFYQIQDPTLFANDLLTEYALSAHNTKGMVWIYSSLGKYVDPLWLTKIFPFVLCVLSALYIFFIGKSLGNNWTGGISAILLVLYSWTAFYFSGGHARAFAFPLALGFLYHLQKKQLLRVAVMVFMQIMTYPPVALISFLCLALLAAKKRRKFCDIFNHKRNIVFALLMAVLVLLSVRIYFFAGHHYGRPFNLKEVVSMPEFYVGGRTVNFVNSINNLRNGTSILENIFGLPIFNLSTQALILMTIISLIYLNFMKEKTPSLLNIYALSGIIGYVAAWVFLANFYRPGRYLRYAFPIYLILISSLAISKCFLKETNRKKISVITLGAVILFVVFGIDLTPDLNTYKNVGLYNFLSTLPKDALIAGHPMDMCEIRTLSKRKVFVDNEMSSPHHNIYYGKMKKRINDFFRLYYSASISEVLELCDLYHIDYLVVNKKHFEQKYLDKKEFFYNPYNGDVSILALRNTGKGFVLKRFAAQHRIYEDANYYVIKADDLKK